MKIRIIERAERNKTVLISARPPSAVPKRRYSVATPASAIHENLFSVCKLEASSSVVSSSHT